MWLPALFLCFSPEVDVAAGIVVGALGVDAVRHSTNRRYLGLSLIPLVLGIHQLVEAVAWWGLQGKVDPATGESAVTLYLALAFVIVPLLVPVAVIGIEPKARRRRWMMSSAVAGCVAASVLAQALAEGPVRAAIGGRYIAYSVDLEHGGLIVVLYVVATCVPLLMSSHRRLDHLRRGEYRRRRRPFVAPGHRSHLAVVCLGCGGEHHDRGVREVGGRTPLGPGSGHRLPRRSIIA